MIVPNLHGNDNAWKQVKIGAGGWVTGIDIAPDGTMVARTDTYGAYIWNGGKWVQLVTAASMPADVYGASGVYEIRIAPSNSNILYMQVDGGLYKSVNKGATWTKTAFSAVSQDANGQNRMDGEKMAVDPGNPNIVYAGTQQNGLFVTRDGGNSWQAVSAVPRGAEAGTSNDPGLTGILFDTSGGSANGMTKVIYAATAGSGVFRSTDAGATWTALSGGPKDVSRAAISSDGSYYATGNSDGSLWKFAGGTWTKLIGSGDVHGVAVDPFNPAHIVAVRDSGNIQESKDGGQTWTGWNWGLQLESSNDVPWLENSGNYMSSGDVAFDPRVPGKLWQSAGVGVWTTQLPDRLDWNTPQVWNSQSAGIEQLVTNDIIAPAGGNPVFASWDRPFFEMPNPDAYATGYGGGHFSMGWSVDYASSNSRFLVGISDWWGTEESGFSTDGGKTWQKFAGLPSFAMNSIGGSIAASSPTNIIWAPAGGHAPAYTTNGGATWTSISLPGKSDWGGFHQGYWLDRTTITADRVLDKTFYLYDVATGVYVTRDGGASWSQVYRGQVSPWSQYNAKIEAVPGRSGELFFTSGPQDAGTDTTPADIGFMRSKDGGATWQAVAGVKEVTTFGYGAPATAGGPPTVFIVGWVNGNYGIFYSADDAQSWTQIGRYPAGSLDDIKTISGDMDQFGLVYVGFSGSGYAYLSFGSGTTEPPPPPPTGPSQTVAVASAEDNVGTTASVGNGALINDATPTLRGTLSAPLATGQFIAVYRDGERIGQLSPTTTSWSFTDPGASDGTRSYILQVENSAGQRGTPSASFTLHIDTAAPAQRVDVTSAVDDAGASTGTLASGAATDDTSPLIRGALSAPLASGETLAVFRDGVRVGQASISNGQWSFQDGGVSTGGHSYTGRVEDAAGNAGAQSSAFLLTVEAVAAIRTLTGTNGNDTLVGTSGSERLSGVPDGGTRPGRGTIDVLTGGGGADVFVLGDGRGVFYDDGRANSAGTGDYARITDFGADDRLQLPGTAANYLQTSLTLAGGSGMGIFYDSNANGVLDSRDELIALIQNHGPVDPSAFLFV